MIGTPVSASTGALTGLSAHLRELKAIVSTRAGSATPSNLNAARREAGAIADQIDRVAGFDLPAPFRTVNFRVEAPDLSVVRAVTGSAKHVNPPEFDVDLDVTASAQVAGFLLSLGGPTINLGGRGQNDGASDLLVLDITGPLGTRQLSFASGTALNDMVAQINSFTDVTGVHVARAGDGSLRLESTGVGSEQFVSVKVVDDGSISGAGGIYRLDPTDTNSIDTNTAPVAFSAAANPLTDQGQDVAATVNGKPATGSGDSLSYATTRYHFTIELTRAAAQTLGQRYAFHFNANRPSVQSEGDALDAGPLLPDTYA